MLILLTNCQFQRHSEDSCEVHSPTNTRLLTFCIFSGKLVLFLRYGAKEQSRRWMKTSSALCHRNKRNFPLSLTLLLLIEKKNKNSPLSWTIYSSQNTLHILTHSDPTKVLLLYMFYLTGNGGVDGSRKLAQGCRTWVEFRTQEMWAPQFIT